MLTIKKFELAQIAQVKLVMDDQLVKAIMIVALRSSIQPKIANLIKLMFHSILINYSLFLTFVFQFRMHVSIIVS